MGTHKVDEDDAILGDTVFDQHLDRFHGGTSGGWNVQLITAVQWKYYLLPSMGSRRRT
jgi:hypothetical protein